LTSILGNAGLLSEGLPRNSELWDAAEQIEKAGQHATGLVRQMLAFCGKASFSPERLDLSTLVSESVELLRASISKTAELRCDLAEGLPAIDADVTQLRQVLINLVVNASEAIGNSAGIIRVITGRADVRPGDNGTVLNGPLRPGCYVSLKISDTGRGMTDDTKGRVFEPFFSTKFSGRGLGLAAVEGIVRSHHGAIRLHSRPGQGTVMEILFPALEGAAASQQTAEMDSDAGWHAQGRVLVVDDEESVRNVAKAILKRAGLEVITAAGGREALSILHRNGTNGRKIGAVLLDLVMPQVSGQEVLRQLRAFSPELPVILSSGYNDEHELAAQLTSFGPTIFLAKPYRPAELLEKVRGALNLQPKAAQPAAATNGRK
jgi:CheY-like chemotaxis protein